MSQFRILVTGGSGFIGRALIPQLIPQAKVSLLLLEEFARGDKLPGGLKRLRSEFDVVYADLRNYQTTARAVRQAKPDRVIHLAAVGSTDPFLNPHTAISHNISGTLNLIKACFQTEKAVEQLIVARTPGELAAMNPYAASKAAAWAFCSMYARTAGWPIHGAMIFQAYGADQPDHLLVPAAMRVAIAGEDFPTTEGHQRKDWIFIDDIAEGLIRMLTARMAAGETIELGTGQVTSVREVVQMIYDLVGRGGRPLFGALPTRPGEVTDQKADTTLSRELLQWQPTISLHEGLQRIFKALNDEPGR